MFNSRRCIVNMVLLGLLGISSLYGEEKNLVAYYDFDEGSGYVVHDKSGNGNDGEIHGAEYVKHGSGYALQFDGKDYVDCGKDKSLNVADAISVEA